MGRDISARSIVLKPITAECVGSFKAVRLRALLDTPTAFGSTYAKEVLLADAEWEKRVGQWNGENSTARLAWDGEEACGIVAGFLSLEDLTTAVLVSMWVAPTHRRRGVGRLLVEAVSDWARSKQARKLRLMVTDNNQAAIEFYGRLGFVKTGKTEPYPNDPKLMEVEMERELGAAGD